MRSDTPATASDQRALDRVCRHLRAALNAEGVAVWRETPPAVVAQAGQVPRPGAAGVEAWPVVYAGEPVAQLAWSAAGDVSAHHGLVAAAVDIVAPLVTAPCQSAGKWNNDFSQSRTTSSVCAAAGLESQKPAF